MSDYTRHESTSVPVVATRLFHVSRGVERAIGGIGFLFHDNCTFHGMKGDTEFFFPIIS